MCVCVCMFVCLCLCILYACNSLCSCILCINACVCACVQICMCMKIFFFSVKICIQFVFAHGMTHRLHKREGSREHSN